MTRISKLILIFSFFVLSFINNTYGQKTIDELGTIVFNAFKNDSIDNICKLKPSAKQLEQFMESLGIDKRSLSIKDIDKMNKGLIVELQKLCNQIHQDSLIFNLSWNRAVIEKVKSTETKGIIGSSNAKGNVVIVTIAEVYFSSNNQHFILELGDINKIDETWKLGGGNFKLKINDSK